MRCWKVNNYFIILIIFIFGIILGSFFNVCIYRIPRGKSIIYPSSHCPKCGTPLKFYDNIPVISYLFLGGRCRYCGARISPIYPLVEILTGILYVVSYLYFRASGIQFLSAVFFVSFLIIITFIDLEHMIIPDVIVYPGIFAGFLFSFLKGKIFLYDGLLGALIGGLAIFLIVFLSRGGMGEGDIKLSAMIGSFLGVKYVIMSLIISFIVGGIVGAFLLLLKIKGRKDPIPFGPFLSIGAIISLFWGSMIANMWGWY